MNTERASYFTERSYTTSEAENKKDIFEYWKKILGEDTLRVAEKCYGIDLVALALLFSKIERRLKNAKN